MTHDSGFPVCPLPLRHSTIQLAHGGGGRLMRELVEHVMLPAFGAPAPDARHDSAVFDVERGRLALTTDSYVVTPLLFPGGDIGKLAVYGTVNDLAMAGAEPRYLSAGFILEEGLEIAVLQRLVQSMASAAREACVQVVTGDTKVVDRGRGHGVYINTSGVGFVPESVSVLPARIEPGDVVLLSGDVGRHGVAVLSVREGLQFETEIRSDCAVLWPIVSQLITAGLDLHCLRDLTRGGLAAALNELAIDANLHIAIDETRIAVDEAVAGACELLGLDPLYVACEGRCIVVLPERHVARALGILRSAPGGDRAVPIGRIVERTKSPAPGIVQLRSRLGTTRILDLLSGEQLPRIC